MGLHNILLACVCPSHKPEHEGGNYIIFQTSPPVGALGGAMVPPTLSHTTITFISCSYGTLFKYVSYLVNIEPVIVTSHVLFVVTYSCLQLFLD